MKYATKSILAGTFAACLTLTAHAFDDRFDNVYGTDSPNSKSSSFSSIPAGAHVVLEGAANASGSTASGWVSGGNLYLSVNFSYPNAGDDEGFTAWADTIYYSLSATGTSYAFVEIEWF
jgi:hypothetical protein